MALPRFAADEEVGIERIDADILMENVRQSTAKFSFEPYYAAARKNLMDKRMTFDNETRIDVMQALSIMRRRLPISKTASLDQKLASLASNLECSLRKEHGGVTIQNTDIHLEIVCSNEQVSTLNIGYFGRALGLSSELAAMLQADDWSSFRKHVQTMARVVPASANRELKERLVAALEGIERMSGGSAGTMAKLTDINTSELGFVLPRNAVRPARLYFSVEPSYIFQVQPRPSLNPELDIEVPYAELTLEEAAKETEFHLPNGDVFSVPCALLLRFSTPWLLSAATLDALRRVGARPLVIRQRVNLFRYLAGFTQKDSIVELSGVLGGREEVFEIEQRQLGGEQDAIVNELVVEDTKHMAKVISLLRSQCVFNSAWESLVALSPSSAESDKRRSAPPSVTFKLTPTPPRCYSAVFSTEEHGILVARIENEEDTWIARILTLDEESLSPETDAVATKAFDRSWSLAIALGKTLDYLGIAGEPRERKQSAAVKDEAMDVEIAAKELKATRISSAWRINRPPRPRTPEHVLEVDENIAAPCGLLDLMLELEQTEELVQPVMVTRPRGLGASLAPGTGFPGGLPGVHLMGAGAPPYAAARATRLASENTLNQNAYSDLEAICQMADSLNNESSARSATPGIPLGHSPYPVGGGQHSPSSHQPSSSLPSPHMGCGGFDPRTISPLAGNTRVIHGASPLASSLPGHPPHPGMRLPTAAPLTPSPHPQMGQTPQQQHGQYSPQEAARHKFLLQQQQNAAIFDFPDETSLAGSLASPAGSNASGSSSYSSPSAYGAPFAYPTGHPGGATPSPHASPLTRGTAAGAVPGSGATPRRRGTRGARKAANIGDRTASSSSLDSPSSVGEAPKRARGKGRGRSGRGAGATAILAGIGAGALLPPPARRGAPAGGAGQALALGMMQRSLSDSLPPHQAMAPLGAVPQQQANYAAASAVYGAAAGSVSGEEDSDSETDPPPPPPHMQQQLAGTSFPASSSVPSSQPSLSTPSSTPATAAGTWQKTEVAQAAAVASQPPQVVPPRQPDGEGGEGGGGGWPQALLQTPVQANPQPPPLKKKSNLEALVGKLQRSVESGQASAAGSRKGVVNDLFDAETSPPPISSHTQSSVGSTVGGTPATSSGSTVSGTPTASSAPTSAHTTPRPTDSPRGEAIDHNKIILKIAKPPSSSARNSPNVDKQQKKEKERDREKPKKDRGDKDKGNNKSSLKSSDGRKRKGELSSSGEKKDAYKKSRQDDISGLSSIQHPLSTMVPSLVPNLKNFKIPKAKKEDKSDSTASLSSSTLPSPSSAMSSGSPFGFPKQSGSERGGNSHSMQQLHPMLPPSHGGGSKGPSYHQYPAGYKGSGILKMSGAAAGGGASGPYGPRGAGMKMPQPPPQRISAGTPAAPSGPPPSHRPPKSILKQSSVSGPLPPSLPPGPPPPPPPGVGPPPRGPSGYGSALGHIPERKSSYHGAEMLPPRSRNTSGGGAGLPPSQPGWGGMAPPRLLHGSSMAPPPPPPPPPPSSSQPHGWVQMNRASAGGSHAHSSSSAPDGPPTLTKQKSISPETQPMQIDDSPASPDGLRIVDD